MPIEAFELRIFFRMIAGKHSIYDIQRGKPVDLALNVYGACIIFPKIMRFLAKKFAKLCIRGRMLLNELHCF